MKAPIFCFLIMLHLQVAAQSLSIADMVRSRLDSGSCLLHENDRPELAIELAMNVMEYDDVLKELGEGDLRKRIQINMIEALARLQSYDLAIPYVKRLLELEAGDKQGPSKLTYLNLGRLATFYMYENEKELSLKTYLEALDVAEALRDATYCTGALNNLGIWFETFGQPDSAAKYYTAALRSFVPVHPEDSVTFISIRDNQAGLLYRQGSIEESISILEENFALLPGIRNQNQRLVKTGLKLCEQYLEMNNTERAGEILEILAQHLDSPNRKWLYEARMKIEHTWIALAEQCNATDLLIAHYTRLDKLMTEIIDYELENTKSAEKILADLSMKHVKADLQKRSEMLALVENDARLNKYMLILLACFSTFILVSVLIFYRRKVAYESMQKRLKESELRNQALINKQLQRDLDYKERDFSDLMMQVALKTDWAKDVTEKVNSLINGSSGVEASELKRLVIDLKQQSSIHEKIELYQQGMDEVNARFFALLEERFPALSRTEREICGLMRLNLDGKEIAAIRNIHPSSVRKMRQRIRKKISLGPSEDLYYFIQAI